MEIPPRRRVLATAALGVAVLTALGAVALVLPATIAVEKSRCVAVDAQRACTKREVEPVELAIMPGDAQAVAPRMSVTGATTYPSTGELLFVTVTQAKLDLLDWLALRRNDAAQLFSHREYYGDQTPQQQRSESVQMMRTAKDVAEYVALDRAGLKPKLVGGSVIVDQLCLATDGQGACTFQAPAAKVLQHGDQIDTINGTKIANLDDLQAFLGTVKAGDVVKVGIERKDDSGQVVKQTVDVATILNPRDGKRTMIGFLPFDTRRVELPAGVKVDIATGEISGPSAGAAFTLTLIDQLTAGNLLGNNRVAVTGTIDIDGGVGPIGGLTSKTQAVKNAGVKYFLVPTAQGEADIAAARRVAGDDVRIIPVATIDEAITALVELGGERPRAAPPGATR